MKKFDLNSMTVEEISWIISKLNAGGIGIMPTDTIYGIHGKTSIKNTVEKIYYLKLRESKKPMIILISSINDLANFNINLSSNIKRFLEEVWPNSLSVILESNDDDLEYLHKKTNSLAFRLPKNYFLLKVLKNTGPLISTSANFSGDKPAIIIDEAVKKFGEKIDFYIDGGELNNPPSTVIEIKNNKIKILREGSVKLTQLELSGF